MSKVEDEYAMRITMLITRLNDKEIKDLDKRIKYWIDTIPRIQELVRKLNPKEVQDEDYNGTLSVIIGRHHWQMDPDWVDDPDAFISYLKKLSPTPEEIEKETGDISVIVLINPSGNYVKGNIRAGTPEDEARQIRYGRVHPKIEKAILKDYEKDKSIGNLSFKYRLDAGNIYQIVHNKSYLDLQLTGDETKDFMIYLFERFYCTMTMIDDYKHLAGYVKETNLKHPKLKERLALGKEFKDYIESLLKRENLPPFIQ